MDFKKWLQINLLLNNGSILAALDEWVGAEKGKRMEAGEGTPACST